MGLASGLALAAVVEAKPSVTVSTAHGVNFSAYRTYGWINIAKPTSGTLKPSSYERIISDLESALASKGYHKSDRADLGLNLKIGAEEKTQTHNLGRFGGHVTFNYAEGPMSLEVIDNKTQRSLWRGQVIHTYNRAKPNSDIDSAISNLMQRFPGSAAASGR
jgi:hypothetical protein